MPSTKVYLSTLGRPVDPADAQISVFDRGFLYGDSVYETMRTSGGRPVELQRHLQRLTRSAEGIGLQLPFSSGDIEVAIHETQRASGNEESYQRVIVTRGAGPIALDPRTSEDPTLVVVVQPLKLPDASLYERGLAVVVVGVEKAGGGLVDPGIKTGNYLNNILALKMAIAQGGQDAIMCNGDGDIAEGATSNVFLIRNGSIATPHLETGLLAGITRQAVFELATEAGYPPAETRIRPDDLRSAQEVFLTSSVRGIMPVTKVDGQPVGSGTVGPVTRELLASYQAYLQRWANR